MTDIKEVLQEQDQQKRDDLYNKYVKEKTPTHNSFLNCCKAFLIGGLICTLGQALINLFISMGIEKDLAVLYEMLILIGLSALLTGMNLYQKLAKFGGAGTLVPITGFANSVVASAIEYQKEGQVFGIGCKIFTIAGPVILYGILSSWFYGILYMILGAFGVHW